MHFYLNLSVSENATLDFFILVSDKLSMVEMLSDRECSLLSYKMNVAILKIAIDTFP
ncbi:MAG: hypothetical protein ACI8RP_002122 [Urechidicola sp.]|jgi:hypothetical protein